VDEDVVDLLLDGDGVILVRDEPGAADVDHAEHLLGPEAELRRLDRRVARCEVSGETMARGRTVDEDLEDQVIHLLRHERLFALALVAGRSATSREAAAHRLLRYSVICQSKARREG